ncbi:hypothetical protein HanRHA438_Chr03g0107441 [Helianthus annuus]|nr:hypothetical protein HanRHA438_Chr03g0107441 [Helianthus annuus]
MSNDGVFKQKQKKKPNAKTQMAKLFFSLRGNQNPKQAAMSKGGSSNQTKVTMSKGGNSNQAKSYHV